MSCSRTTESKYDTPEAIPRIKPDERKATKAYRSVVQSRSYIHLKPSSLPLKEALDSMTQWAYLGVVRQVRVLAGVSLDGVQAIVHESGLVLLRQRF
jgi:hypothetical protein